MSLTDIARQLESLAPQAWTYAVYIARVDALLMLAMFVALAGVGLVLLRCQLHAAVLTAEAHNGRERAKGERDYGERWSISHVVFEAEAWRLTVIIPAALALSVGTIALICSPWMWLTAIDPQLGLAHQVLAKLLAHG